MDIVFKLYSNIDRRRSAKKIALEENEEGSKKSNVNSENSKKQEAKSKVKILKNDNKCGAR